MPKERSLSDLYVRGREVTLDDGTGDPLVVWVQKLNPVEHAQIVRKAGAARSRIIALKFDKESEDYLAIANGLIDAERPLLIEMLAMAERARITPLVEAEIADEEQWKEDQYLQGLFDAWNDEVRDRFEADASDGEAKRIHDELGRYLDAVNEKIVEQISFFSEGLETMSDKELLDTALDARLKAAGDTAWVNEYYRSEVWLATRDAEDHKKRLMQNREDVDSLMGEAYETLAAALRDLAVDPIEGKDSAGIPPSSPSSEASAPAETEQPSGPAAAVA